jgi:hypothetical protein
MVTIDNFSLQLNERGRSALVSYSTPRVALQDSGSGKALRGVVRRMRLYRLYERCGTNTWNFYAVVGEEAHQVLPQE